MCEDTKNQEKCKRTPNLTENFSFSGRGEHTIRLAFPDDVVFIENSAVFRSFLDNYYKSFPLLFPVGFSEGYCLHSIRKCKKGSGISIRRIKLRDGSVYSVVPSSQMPYLIGDTKDVSKSLLLRSYGVPYEVIATVLGRNSAYWERAEKGLSRFSIVGTVCQGNIPTHLAADEKVTFINGKECYGTITAGKNCVLGANLSLSEDTEGLQQAYQSFKEECLDCKPDYQPESVNLDGWKATNASWANLFANITIVLCFLHSFIKIREIGKKLKEKYHELGTMLWNNYAEPNAAAFKKGLTETLIWAKLHLQNHPAILGKVQDIIDKEARFATAYKYPEAYRTSNQVDRPMNDLDRYLYQTRYFHGHLATAQQKMRAWAMIYNFKPFQKQTVKKMGKNSRFEELNGFKYHQNWLQNMLIAGSMNGFRTHHTIR